jgi:hypothetical protein
VTKLVFYSALYRTHYPDEKTLARYQLIIIGPRACDVLVLCISGCRARMRGAPCHAVIASPVVHGWLRVWAERIPVVVILYESGWLRGFPHINPHHAFPQHVQVKACTLGVITQGSRKVLARL